MVPDENRQLIWTQNGKYFAVVDRCDFEWLSGFRWYRTPKGYFYTKDGRKALYMHRMIVGNKESQRIDHIDHDPSNNTRSNLRPCTAGQNNAYKLKNKEKKAGYKGVTWVARLKKWKATICKNRETFHLGYFLEEKAAARAYDRRAIEIFGDFALPNFPRSEY